MSVDARELRPRTAVPLFDAAVRVCSTTAGVWALTLPAGVGLVYALFELVDAVRLHRSLVGPVGIVTAAWLFRALSQGAASHHVEETLLRHEPTVLASWVAALKRAPSLFITAAFLAVLNSLILAFTAGLGFLFLGAQTVGYAATMRGQGNPLGIYGTCVKLLGPARHTATWVRICGLSQLLLGLNLHLFIALLLQLGRELLGLDVTFPNRFCSLDNGLWVGVVAVITFSLFEPLRAAAASLLLIDGRVRQEGLDLLAIVEQLPRRKKPRVAAVVATALVLIGALPAFGRPPAHPTPPPRPAAPTLRAPKPAVHAATGALRSRLDRAIAECDLEGRVDSKLLADVDSLSPKDQAALSRFVSRIERRVIDDQDCDAAEADLREGLKQVHAAREAQAEVDANASREAAQKILARPEFQVAPPAEAKVEPGPDEKEAPGWLSELFVKFLRWLRDLLESDSGPQSKPSDFSFGGPMAGADLVMIGAVLLIIGLLVYLLLRWRDPKNELEVDADVVSMSETRLEADPMSALAKPAETWAGLADQLAAQGQFREAIRHLYLALLSRLHREGAIDYDPTRSNWDYLLFFKGPREHKGPFRELTRRFDFAWYGNLDVDSSAWSVFRHQAEPMLTRTDSEASGA